MTARASGSSEATPATRRPGHAVVTSDPDGRIVFWNAGAERIFGYAASEVVGQPLSVIIPARFRDAHDAGFRRVRASGRSELAGRTLTLTAIRRGGEEFPIELTIETWIVSEHVFFTGSIRDLSANEPDAEADGDHGVEAESDSRHERAAAGCSRGEVPAHAKMRTRRHHKRPLIVAGAIASVALAGLFFWFSRTREPIRIGLLHSQSGTMAISERSLLDAELLAISEINAAGGLLGRQIEAVIADGRSDPATFAREAERLIRVEKVSVLFGCWTSASRKAVKAVVERHNHLLFYPVQFEGLETSPNIVYTGPAPNQQIIPALRWAVDHLGRDFFLVGSDYVFPRAANAIARDYLGAFGGRVVGEEYVPLAATDFSHVVRRIEETRPAVLLNTLNGDSNVAFFRALHAAGLKPPALHVVSFSLGEEELRRVEHADGHYGSWPYFESVAGAENRSFVEAFKRQYGGHRPTGDPIEAAYASVHLWAAAVNDARSGDTDQVRRWVRMNQSFPAPGGTIHVDPLTQYTWKHARIGRIRRDGRFDVVWSSPRPVRPEPYPTSRLQVEWVLFLNDLRTRWNGQWGAPASRGGAP